MELCSGLVITQIKALWGSAGLIQHFRAFSIPRQVGNLFLYVLKCSNSRMHYKQSRGNKAPTLVYITLGQRNREGGTLGQTSLKCPIIKNALNNSTGPLCIMHHWPEAPWSQNLGLGMVYAKMHQKNNEKSLFCHST